MVKFLPYQKGLENLLEANLPNRDPENIEYRVNNAILKFRRYRSSIDDRRDAIRDLADVLEFLRPKLKTVITRHDENDLFNIANNFGIRHHNDLQKPSTRKQFGIVGCSIIIWQQFTQPYASLKIMKKRIYPATKVPSTACNGHVEFAAIFKHFSSFEFSLLPNNVYGRPPASKSSR